VAAADTEVGRNRLAPPFVLENMRRALLPLLVLIALPSTSFADTAEDYAVRVAELETMRLALAGTYDAAATDEARAIVLDRAREAVIRALVDDLIPAWHGTPWDFNGTSEIPGQGHIACGYYVTTLLRDAGFRVQRARLAQQASENIIKSLVGEDRITRYRNVSGTHVAGAVAELGDGLYVVGLDIHVGFLVVEDGTVRFCHASYLDPVAAVCESPRTAPAFISGYRVVGKLLDDPMMLAWLRGQAFPTKGT
jgi:hypothetical protein